MLKKKVLSEAAYYDIDSMFACISQDGKHAAGKLRLRIHAIASKI